MPKRKTVDGTIVTDRRGANEIALRMLGFKPKREADYWRIWRGADCGDLFTFKEMAWSYAPDFFADLNLQEDLFDSAGMFHHVIRLIDGTYDVTACNEHGDYFQFITHHAYNDRRGARGYAVLNAVRRLQGLPEARVREWE